LKHDPRRQQRLLTLGSGGWVLILAGLLGLAIVVAWTVYLTSGRQGVGDGYDPATYGFDLSNLAVSSDHLIGAGFSKDGMRRLVDPQYLTPDQIPALNEVLREQHVGKSLVDTELVIGLVLDGQARAYPTRIMLLHEVFNDELAGVPIVVTHNGLCDSSAVFRRIVDGDVLEFGVSGLLYNSNLVMYDRQNDPARESLWSQLKRQAISGPRVGEALTPLPIRVLPWSDWKKMYPETDVVLPPQEDFRRYKRVTYHLYYSQGKPQFPISHPPGDQFEAMTPVLAFQSGGQWLTLPYEALPDARWSLPSPAGDLALIRDERAQSAWFGAAATEQLPATVYSRWFAWHTMYPEAPLIEISATQPTAP
jgi:hypothetical protein